MKFEFVNENKDQLPEVGEWFYFNDKNSYCGVLFSGVLFMRIENEKGSKALGHNSTMCSNYLYMVALETTSKCVAGRIYYNSSEYKNIILVEPSETIKLKRK